MGEREELQGSFQGHTPKPLLEEQKNTLKSHSTGSLYFSMTLSNTQAAVMHAVSSSRLVGVAVGLAGCCPGAGLWGAVLPAAVWSSPLGSCRRGECIGTWEGGGQGFLIHCGLNRSL